jgi:hypothetical protein
VPRKNCDHALALLKGPGRSDDEVKSIGSKLTDANGTADRGINQMSLKATSKPRSSQDQGGVLLSVHCDTSDEITRAKDLLKHTGAQDISSSGEASADYPAASKAGAHR